MEIGFQHLFDNALVVALRNDNVFFDTVGTTPEHLRIAAGELGTDRIMFGTDWSATWRWVRDPGDVHQMRLGTIDAAGLTPAGSAGGGGRRGAGGLTRV